jgi:hypothetical protein
MRVNCASIGVFPIGGIRSQGWLAGGHAGYNWQYTSLVAGLGDFGTVEPTSSVTSTVPGAFQSADRGGHQTIETVRAGVSYKFTP